MKKYVSLLSNTLNIDSFLFRILNSKIHLFIQRHTDFGNKFYQTHFGISNEIYRGCSRPFNGNVSGQWNTNASSCDICMLQVDFIPVTYPEYSNSYQNMYSNNSQNMVTNANANNSTGMSLFNNNTSFVNSLLFLSRFRII